MRSALGRLLSVKISSSLFVEMCAIRTGHHRLLRARPQHMPVGIVILSREGNPVVEKKYPIDMGADEEVLLSEHAVPQRLTVSWMQWVLFA